MNIVANVLRLFVFLLLLTMVDKSDAGQLTIAVASNFTGAMKTISTVFSKATGIAIKPVYASTGKLYAMIENGGPFDLFFAADNARPMLLYTKGLSYKPFVYATGEVVLWTNIPELCSAQNWQEAIKQHRAGQIAIANPELAPYGSSAMQAISMVAIPKLKKRLVYGQNVAQAFSFAHKVTGIGFVASSLVRTKQGRQGCYWPVEQASKVEQSACVLKRPNRNVDADKFAAFFVSSQAKTMLTDFGYSD